MNDKNPIRFPGVSDRTAIVGRTGSGKTVYAVWVLSRQSFDSMPWVILDFKRDELINSIKGAKHIGYETIPTKPGIYILHPIPGETEKLETYLWGIWKQGNIGLYVDEGYMIGPSDAFEAILTQGRSLRIPTIILSQRPVWLTRFAFSEATFLNIFDLSDDEDMKTVRRYVKRKLWGELKDDIPEYHSYFYDAAQKRLIALGPAPKGEKIIEAIEAKLKPIRRTL